MARRHVGAVLAVCVAAGGFARAGEVTVCATPMAAIADASPGSPVVVSLDVVVPYGATVTDVRVSLDVAHDWVGDLVATVEHEGVVVSLLDQVALGVYPFGCGGNDLDLIFDDGASAGVDALCEPAAVPNVDVSGVVLPRESLSAFAGVPADGAWTVRVADVTAFDVGVLREVCVTVVYEVVGPCSPADVTTTGSASGVPDGAVDLSDFSYYLTLWSSGDPAADLTATGTCVVGSGEGVVDLSDFSCYLTAWGVGCP